jgi:hypothetical protein
MIVFLQFEQSDERRKKERFQVRLKFRMLSPVRAADNSRRQPVKSFHLNRRHGTDVPASICGASGSFKELFKWLAAESAPIAVAKRTRRDSVDPKHIGVEPAVHLLIAQG